MVPPDRYTSLLGEVFADTYRVDAPIGSGGAGAVYRGYHLRLQRPIAIKILLERHHGDDRVLARFEREARVTAALSHPNIVELLDFARTTRGQPFIVMELIDGESLHERLARQSPLPANVAADIALQACAALQVAHDHGVVHRDLKPSNMLLCRRDGSDHYLKLVDFGISKAGGDPDGLFTRSHASLGTPGYMSPEQAAGRSAEVDARADIFALGVVIYEMLSGVHPFARESEVDTLHAIIHEPPPALARLNPAIPDPLVAVLERMLHKQRAKRFGSVAEARSALESAGLASIGTRPAMGLDEAPTVAVAVPTQVVQEDQPSGQIERAGQRASQLGPGQTLNDTYRLERLLGRGTMGAVYEASHLRLDRRFAVKVLRADLQGNPEVLLRFQREARATSSIGHANIIDVIDFNATDEGVQFIVMELLQGEDLDARLARRPLSADELSSMMRQTCSALQAAHDKGVIHRDLKPHNIFLCSGEGRGAQVRVLDFGISKVVDAGDQLTRAGVVMGTPFYMAPEQAEGRAAEVDARTDVYALGAILFEALARRPPFESDGALVALLDRIIDEPAPTLRSVGAAVPESLERVVARALSKRPRDRQPSMQALWDELSAPLQELAEISSAATRRQVSAEAETAVSASQTTPWRRVPSRWPMRAILAAVVLLGLGVALAIGLSGEDELPVASRAARTSSPGAPDLGSADRGRPLEAAVAGGEDPAPAAPPAVAVTPPAAPVRPPAAPVTPPARIVRPVPKAWGRLQVGSTPPGCLVYLDGKRLGRTPLAKRVRAGLRKVEVTREDLGTRTRKMVRVRADKVTIEFFELKK